MRYLSIVALVAFVLAGFAVMGCENKPAPKAGDTTTKAGTSGSTKVTETKVTETKATETKVAEPKVTETK